MTTSFWRSTMLSNEISAEGRLDGIGVFPAQNCPVIADADDVFGEGADFYPADTAAVSDAHLGRLALVVIPNFHQFVIPTWKREKKRR